MAAVSSVVPLGLLHMWPLQRWLKVHVIILRVIYGCTRALVPWKLPRLYQMGVELGLVSRRPPPPVGTGQSPLSNVLRDTCAEP